MIDTIKTLITFDYQGPELNEILRNLSTLYGTVEGTIPLDRSFGLSQDYLSYPVPVAENMIALEITEKTELYEPRVEVEEITFESTTEGTVISKVLIRRNDDYEELGGDE